MSLTHTASILNLVIKRKRQSNGLQSVCEALNQLIPLSGMTSAIPIPGYNPHWHCIEISRAKSQPLLMSFANPQVKQEWLNFLRDYLVIGVCYLLPYRQGRIESFHQPQAWIRKCYEKA